MLNSTLPDGQFRKGLIEYLHQYSGSNTVTDDLWNSITQVAVVCLRNPVSYIHLCFLILLIFTGSLFCVCKIWCRTLPLFTTITLYAYCVWRCLVYSVSTSDGDDTPSLSGPMWWIVILLVGLSLTKKKDWSTEEKMNRVFFHMFEYNLLYLGYWACLML